ncbi:transporter substrate-binding domain-containing protein [Microbacterium sp. NPDC096154]|uniref:substrate-binding periplasmic protein n=1 Tax=Microbacterium sp. NPDC096154 TaxID=3155549 RepID=UPI003326307A
MKLSRSILATAGSLTLLGSLVACASPQSSAAEGAQDLPAALADGKLTFGWAALSGYSALNATTGEVDGFYIDVARRMAEDLGVELELVEDSWPTIVLGLSTGKYEITFAGRTPEREEQADFTENTISADFTFVTKGDASFEGLEDLDVAGNTITVTSGSNTDEALTPLVKNAEILRVRDVGGAILAVQNGSADAMAGVRDYLIASIAEYPELQVLESQWGESLQGLLVDKGQEDLLVAMNDEIAALKEEGVFADLLEENKLVGVEVAE